LARDPRDAFGVAFVVGFDAADKVYSEIREFNPDIRVSDLVSPTRISGVPAERCIKERLEGKEFGSVLQAEEALDDAVRSCGVGY